MKPVKCIGIVLATLVATVAPGSAQTRASHTLSLDGGQRVLGAALAEAQRIGAPGGAIAVSGAASAQQDQEIASAAAASVESWGEAIGVAHFPAAKVADAFAAGSPILEVDAFKIHASRRDGPGKSEIHVVDTDIFYVLDGAATFVTGGTLVAGETTAPNEIRGSGIEGGSTRRLAKGDLVIIPRGTPHWFKEVSPPFVYYTVKVTALGAAG